MSLAALDTDVASALLRRRMPDDLVGQLAGHVVAVTFVTVGELMKWHSCVAGDRGAWP